MMKGLRSTAFQFIRTRGITSRVISASGFVQPKPNVDIQHVAINAGATGHIDSDLKQEKNLTPKELLYSAMSSCSVYTLRGFIQAQAANTSKGRPNLFEGLGVTSIECKIAEVMGKDRHVPERLDIDILIQPEDNGKLTEAHKNAFMSAAHMCPVKRMVDPSLPLKLTIVDLNEGK